MLRKPRTEGRPWLYVAVQDSAERPRIDAAGARSLIEALTPPDYQCLRRVRHVLGHRSSTPYPAEGQPWRVSLDRPPVHGPCCNYSSVVKVMRVAPNESKVPAASTGRTRPKGPTDRFDPRLLALLEPYRGEEVRLRCGTCGVILDVLGSAAWGPPTAMAVPRTPPTGSVALPRDRRKGLRPTHPRPHIRRTYRKRDGEVIGMTWGCSCGREHSRNFVALVEPYVEAVRSGRDLRI